MKTWRRLTSREKCTEYLLGRQKASERKARMRERMRRIEDFFAARQIAFDLGVPYSERYALEEQECTVGQMYIVGSPARSLMIRSRARRS
jgi:hypothetical protein